MGASSITGFADERTRTSPLGDTDGMGLSRRWVTGGAVYTLMIVIALALRLSAQVHVPKAIYSVAVAVSDFGTLPPFFVGIGLYAGQVAGYLS